MLLETPPTILISNSEFRHFFYDFNSLVEMNKFGSIVTIQNSKFEHLSSCGSILTNLKGHTIFDPTLCNSDSNNCKVFKDSQAYSLN